MREVPFPTPGDILRFEWMEPWGHRVAVVAAQTGLPAAVVRQFLAGQIPVTDDLAARLSRYTGWDPGMWLRLQDGYDETMAKAASAV